MKESWEKKYSYAISNWENVRPFFEFSDDIRRIMYMTYIYSPFKAVKLVDIMIIVLYNIDRNLNLSLIKREEI